MEHYAQVLENKRKTIEHVRNETQRIASQYVGRGTASNEPRTFEITISRSEHADIYAKMAEAFGVSW